MNCDREQTIRFIGRCAEGRDLHPTIIEIRCEQPVAHSSAQPGWKRTPVCRAIGTGPWHPESFSIASRRCRTVLLLTHSGFSKENAILAHARRRIARAPYRCDEISSFERPSNVQSA